MPVTPSCGQFLEKVQLLYDHKAREAGTYIIGSCGFDSIPCDMGVAYTRQQFRGEVNDIEAFLKLKFGPEVLMSRLVWRRF